MKIIIGSAETKPKRADTTAVVVEWVFPDATRNRTSLGDSRVKNHSHGGGGHTRVDNGIGRPRDAIIVHGKPAAADDVFPGGRRRRVTVAHVPRARAPPPPSVRVTLYDFICTRHGRSVHRVCVKRRHERVLYYILLSERRKITQEKSIIMGVRIYIYTYEELPYTIRIITNIIYIYVYTCML